ncbi:hypothetical protein Lpp126_08767 [Lacticaseibacillus paracasei subsp. paracasei Lpp126]|uniref:Uncharacterized protein n=1 Tax=Lacticaseibacillus paracasei subsp. paracasei Lpp126 TaxID=1256206 RepID=S2RBE4_LACPA|nr:hypothetical protein Lpp126_08767 [Lacticaseibacillus paracasei subsp. paracasei Lpp126]
MAQTHLKALQVDSICSGLKKNDIQKATLFRVASPPASSLLFGGDMLVFLTVRNTDMTAFTKFSVVICVVIYGDINGDILLSFQKRSSFRKQLKTATHKALYALVNRGNRSALG